jgi:osmotically-inducible protein OsmY
MPGKKPEYGQGFHDFTDENVESKDPWHNRYRYGSHFDRGPKRNSQQRTPADNTIWEEVCDVLANAYDIDARNIEVDVKNSVVTLSGAVRTRLEKIKAEQLVYDLDRVYVNDVYNEIRVDENQKSLS